MWQALPLSPEMIPWSRNCVFSVKSTYIPSPQNLGFHIVVREIGQQKHVRAILSVENIAVMVRHRQELELESFMRIMKP